VWLIKRLHRSVCLLEFVQHKGKEILTLASDLDLAVCVEYMMYCGPVLGSVEIEAAAAMRTQSLCLPCRIQVTAGDALERRAIVLNQQVLARALATRHHTGHDKV